MRILIVYHNACSDGSFAAATVSLAFPMEVIHYLALDHAHPDEADAVTSDNVPLHLLPEIRSYDRIYFVDIAINERQLADLTAFYKNDLFVFDHHNTRSMDKYKAECEALGIQPSTNVVFASQHSGAMLSYFGVINQFSNGSPRIMSMIGNLMRIVQLVSDRDTWQLQNKRAFAFYDGYSREMFADKEETGVLYSTVPSTIANARNIVMNGNVEEIISLGEQRIKERNEHIEKLFKANGKIFEANDIIPQRHAIMSTSRAIGSDAAQWIRDNNPGVKLVLIVRCAPDNAEPEKVFCSVRSDADSPVSAKSVANTFGGDGHVNAAGCVMSRKTFDTFYPEINPDYKQINV